MTPTTRKSALGEAKASGTPASAGIEGRSDDVLSRTSFAIRPGQRVSFATYFNAFPASYWRRWTTAERVRLRVAVEGEATVLIPVQRPRLLDSAAPLRLAHRRPTIPTSGPSRPSLKLTSTLFPSSTEGGTGSTSSPEGSQRFWPRLSG